MEQCECLTLRNKNDSITIMDSGQIVYIVCRLTLGAAAAFLAIMLWSRTRDMAWMFVIVGVLTSYVEVVYSILEPLGISGGNILSIGSRPIASILFPCLPMVFFIIAFTIMVVRKYRR